MQTAKIKICGITNSSDALAAIASGASFLGLIFVKESPRCVKPARAREIIEAVRGKAQSVGVFKDSDAADINALGAMLGLDYVQLHGNESPEECSRIDLPVIKAVQIPVQQLEEISSEKTLKFMDDVRTFKSVTQHLLFDRPKSDKSPEWLRSAIDIVGVFEHEINPYFFAGGLTAANVQSVFTCLKPFAIDVASGVEISPGLKDHAKLDEFCKKVKACQNQHSCLANEGNQA